MMDKTFGELISTYTRAQAIDDGVLIDVSDVAREAGLKYPTAVTQAVWATDLAKSWKRPLDTLDETNLERSLQKPDGGA